LTWLPGAATLPRSERGNVVEDRMTGPLRDGWACDAMGCRRQDMPVVARCRCCRSGQQMIGSTSSVKAVVMDGQA
jgi:hypothetical protein